jgi:hypothetical protein
MLLETPSKRWSKHVVIHPTLGMVRHVGNGAPLWQQTTHRPQTGPGLAAAETSHPSVPLLNYRHR